MLVMMDPYQVKRHQFVMEFALQVPTLSLGLLVA